MKNKNQHTKKSRIKKVLIGLTIAAAIVKIALGGLPMQVNAEAKDGQEIKVYEIGAFEIAGNRITLQFSK